MKNGLEDKFIIKNNKKMRFGYTTGSCAAAAAKAATQMLLTGEKTEVVHLMTPKGIELHLEPKDIKRSANKVSCCIVKDAGDDPDVTDGIGVYAEIEIISSDMKLRKSDDTRSDDFRDEVYFAYDITKGEITQKDFSEEISPALFLSVGPGVGIVTLPGLEQPIGAPAINKASREMIFKAVNEVFEEYNFTEKLKITISAPEGVEIAKKTFNPRLGIEGGISILGTSGIVEPMSETALINSIELEMKQKVKNGKKYLVITPGNYGQSYLKDNFPFHPDDALKCSNFVGQTIDMAVNMGVKGILFVGHVGKFIKLSGGIMNTHSNDADARMELMAANALRAGADVDIANQILNCVTTDEGLRVLENHGILDKTMTVVIEKIMYYLKHRCGDSLEIGVIMFSNVFGELVRSDNTESLIHNILSNN